MNEEEKKRTLQQNKSLHLMFSELAKSLNETGWDVKKTIKAEIPFNAYMCKELIFRPVMKQLTGKDSTAELTTSEIDEVFKIIVKVIGERCGITLNWPSIELLMNGENIAK